MVAKLENSIPGLLKLSLLGTEQDFALKSKEGLSHSRCKFGCEAVAGGGGGLNGKVTGA